MSEEESTNPADYRKGMREAFETYSWVWRELLGDTGRRAGKKLVLCLCIGNLVSMSVPWMLGKMINALQQQHSTKVISFFIGIALVLLTRRGIQYFESHAREIMFGENMGTIDLRSNQMFLSMSLGQHLRENDRLSAGAMDKGRMKAQETMGMLPTEGAETIFLLASSYIALWFVSGLAGLATTGLFALYIVWSLHLNQRVAEVCAPLDEEFRAINRYRMERWKQIERVKTFGKEQEEIEHLTKWWNKILAKDRDFWLWFADQNTWRNVISTIVFLGVMAWNVWAAWQRQENFGMLFPLFAWMYGILDNIWRLGNLEHRINWNLPSIQSLREALSIVPDIVDQPDAKPLNMGNGLRIEIDHVSHTYHPGKTKKKEGQGKRTVLRQLLCTIHPGEVVALVGPSGGGKSTLMRLLQRGMDPEDGVVRLNGQDLRDIQLRSWLARAGCIPQRPAVFDGTVKYNLTYGLSEEERAKVSDKELWKLVQDLKISDRLTEGLNTRIGEGGIELSGGEAQRLMIGAAIVKKPDFFLIDEATSSLDSTTERAVQKLLKNVLARGTGALIIAHRLNTLEHICTKYIVLKPINKLRKGESQIEAIGRSFKELGKKSPTFRKLARDQGIAI